MGHILVLGMHRSGTSAVTRLVGLMGARQGDPNDLVPAAADNPSGFWELSDLVELNSDLLRAVGSTSTSPPPADLDWTADPRVVPFAERADELVRRFGSDRESWVWKDPRLCLTLPFWKARLPDPVVAVLVIRHPLEVATSLRRREDLPEEVSLALWEWSVRQSIRETSDLKRRLVRFDEVLNRPHQVCAMLQEFLTGVGMAATRPDDAAVDEFISPDLRHASFGDDDLADHPAATHEQTDLWNALREDRLDVSSTTSTSAWQLLRFYGDHVRVRELADELYRKEREIEAAEERTREVERAWRAGYARQDRRARDAAAGRTWDAVTAQVTPRFLVERVRTAGAGWRPRGSSADRWRQAVEWATGRPAGAPPRAGLVITSHEDGEFLPDLLNSLSRQTVTDFEVVLVDDYSVDPITVELLDALQGADGLEVFRLPRPCGVIEARNAGVSRLRAPVVACLDADDLVAPEYLEATLSELDRVPSAGFVYFDYRMFGTVEGRVRSPDFDVDRLLDDNYIVASAPFRRRLWEEVGGFWSGMWRGFEDWEFWVHCVARGWSGCRIPRELFYYRRRAASRNSAALAHKEECAALIRSRHPELFGSRGRAGEMGGGHSTDRDPSTP